MISLQKTSIFFILLAIIACKPEESEYYSNDPNKYLYKEVEECNSDVCPEPNYCK